VTSCAVSGCDRGHWHSVDGRQAEPITIAGGVVVPLCDVHHHAVAADRRPAAAEIGSRLVDLAELVSHELRRRGGGRRAA
jgi:hypothetical protein